MRDFRAQYMARLLEGCGGSMSAAARSADVDRKFFRAMVHESSSIPWVGRVESVAPVVAANVTADVGRVTENNDDDDDDNDPSLDFRLRRDEEEE